MDRYDLTIYMGTLENIFQFQEMILLLRKKIWLYFIVYVGTLRGNIMGH